MTGPQKAAILLLTLGEDSASEIMKNLNEAEIKELGQYMSEFSHVGPKDVDRVMNEFFLVAEKGRFLPGPPETKVEYLKNILTRAMGEEHAAKVVEQMVAVGQESTLEKLKWHDPTTIAGFLAEEHPQVIAVILANMGDPALSQRVIAALPERMQKDILTRYAQIRTIPEDWLEEIEASLEAELAASRPAPDGSAIGEAQVARVLGNAPAPMEDMLIDHLRAKNPELAERISKRIFSFADLLKLDNYAVQLVIKRTTGKDLVLALKLADEPLFRHLLRNMSDDTAAKVQNAVDGLGPVPMAQIEAAQKRIANTARILIEEGKATPLVRRPKSTEPPG